MKLSATTKLINLGWLVVVVVVVVANSTDFEWGQSVASKASSDATVMGNNKSYKIVLAVNGQPTMVVDNNL